MRNRKPGTMAGCKDKKSIRLTVVAEVYDYDVFKPNHD